MGSCGWVGLSVGPGPGPGLTVVGLGRGVVVGGSSVTQMVWMAQAPRLHAVVVVAVCGGTQPSSGGSVGRVGLTQMVVTPQASWPPDPLHVVVVVAVSGGLQSPSLGRGGKLVGRSGNLVVGKGGSSVLMGSGL